MGFQRKINQPPEVNGPWCIHLRSKGMYVREDFNTTDPYESGNSHYWCLVNQHVFGPDNIEVGRESCIPGRRCYCDTIGQMPPKAYPAETDAESQDAGPGGGDVEAIQNRPKNPTA